ncbi:MAG: NAD(P)(+) transhydrogenase (Re/Si-specific) subunit beta, partial [Gammaproteobacteria bacterium]|nr:NAD(P)(+) transhydrogenase (Re/Si-specific) subunit beta [Gammaproteobacteria bacterium]
MDIFIQVVYFVAAVLFILGLKKMSSPVTATGGIVWAGIGMIAASLVAFFEPGVFTHTSNVVLIIVAIGIGSAIAYITAKRVQMTDMPQMIAIYNGMGGGAAAAIAAVELVKMAGGHGGSAHELSSTAQVLAVIGALIGAVSFSGSAIAFAKLQGLMKKTIRLPMHMVLNLGLFVLTLIAGVIIGFSDDVSIQLVLLFFVLALVFGVLFTTPIGGADMPVVISLFNALTGLAVAFEGYVLENAAMIIAGTVVGSAGTLLTQLMAKAMNR